MSVYHNAAQITITVTGNASETKAEGNISFVLNGITYNRGLTDGTVTVEVPDLGEGHYIVDVTYSGDRYYDAGNGYDDFNVYKDTLNIEFTATDVKVNDNTTVTVTLSVETDGIVTINLDSVAYNITVVNGVGTKSIKVTKDGIMYVSGWFVGNDDYVKSNTNYTTFESTKRASQINVTAKTIRFNEVATVSVSVTPGATGNVTVTVNGREKTIKLDADGKGLFEFEGLDVGTYTVFTQYSGDYQYEKSENDMVSLSVIKGVTTININTPEEVLVGDDAVITINVGDATGELEITLGTYTQTVDVNGAPRHIHCKRTLLR